MHQSRRFPSAAGRSNPGTTPVLAQKNPLNFSRFGTEAQWPRHSCLLALTQEGCAPAFHAGTGRAMSGATTAQPLPADRSAVVANSNRHTPISNRHLVRLEIIATPTKSTTSLFLIDTKQRNCFASITARGIGGARAAAWPTGGADLQLRRPVAATPASSASAVADHLRRARNVRRGGKRARSWRRSRTPLTWLPRRCRSAPPRPRQFLIDT